MPQLNDIIIDGTAKFKIVRHATSNDISNLQNQINNIEIDTATSSKAGISKIYDATGSNTDGGMTQAAITNAINSHTPSTATTSSAGITKLYVGTGTATDGTMTQKAITDAIASASATVTSIDGGDLDET